MSAILPLENTSVNGPIDFKDVVSPAEVKDNAALKMVTRDAASARSWIESRYFNVRWIEIDLLYQSPPTQRVWEGTSIPKANIAKFTVATHVNAINSKLIGGLFYEETPFNLVPRSSMSQDSVRAIEELSSTQLDEMGFKQEVKYGLFSTLLNGTGIWKWGWKEYTETEWEFTPKELPAKYSDPNTGDDKEIPTQDSDAFYMKPVDKLRAHPYLENCDIRQVLPDPGLQVPDISKAKWVIHEFPVTYRDLIKMSHEFYYNEKNEKIFRYNLPSEKEIRMWFEPPVTEPNAAQAQAAGIDQTSSIYVQHAAGPFTKTTEDPLDEPLLIQERWDSEKVMTVLQGIRLIRNEPNPLGCVPFYSVAWWMIQNSFWGIGLGTALGGEQRLQQGFINAVADVGTLAANQPIIRSRGANVNTQQVRARLGGFIDVDGDVQKALMPMELPKIQSEMFSVVQASEQRTESTSGASAQLTMGSSPGKATSLGRTATGAGGMIQAAVDRIGGLVEDFNRQVFQPFLWQMYELNRKFLPPTVYREILSDVLGTEFKATIQDFVKAKKGIKTFEVLAGSHLAARQQMAQSMPLIMQYFTNPALAGQIADINGEYVDFSELLHMMTDVSGWGSSAYYSILKPLTPAMKQQRAAQANAKADQAKEANDQKFKQKAQLQEQNWTQRAAGDIIRHSIQTVGSPQSIEGAPGGKGLGGGELQA